VQSLSKALTREFPGKVRASQRVQLAFSVSGLIVELNALEGRVVRKGEIIAQLDRRDYQNAMDVAKANYTDAKQSFNRTEQLRKQKVVAEAEFDRAKATFDTAAAELRIREKALSDTVLLAPFDGIVVARYMENHEHVDAKQAIVSIQDITRVEIVLQVPESLMAHGGAKSLQNIAVRIEADGDRWFDVSLREFSSQADPVTRTYELVLAMEPPKDIEVLPGMTTTVRAQVQRQIPLANWTEGLTLVPAAAVVNAPDGSSYVWLVDEVGGHPRRTPVILGDPREDGIEVRSGLTPGQRVATAGVHMLDEEVLVRPMHNEAEGLEG
jgi:RND family efflux transporter MFP subunit